MERIEELAEEYLAEVPAYIWDGASLPVPVEEIADSHAGLLVRDVEDLRSVPGALEFEHGEILSGLLLPRLGEIWVNAREAREWPGRRRFTIAHELGHWRLHRGADEASVFCRSGSIEAEATEATPLGASPEQEANLFAATLLMPAQLLREQYLICERDFSRLCETFVVSAKAMGRRLHAVVGVERAG